MHPVIEKQTAASLHILGLILECGKTEISVIRVLSEAFTHVVPSGAVLNAGLLSETLENLKGFMSEGCSACPGEDVKQPGEIPAEAPAPAPAKKTTSRAKATPAPAPEVVTQPPVLEPAAPAPAPVKEAVIQEVPDAVEDHALPEDTALSPEAAERLRALIRDTFTARSKKIAAEGDPNNARKLSYTAKFTEAVKSFGADTVTLTDNSKLQDLLDTVRAL